MINFTEEATDNDNTDRLRDGDIQALLEAGVDMVQLETLYGAKAVHRVTESYIMNHEIEDTHDRKSKLATLLFLRAPSSSLQHSLTKSDDVLDAVLEALVADPDDPLLMDPLLHTLLHDPVVLSSGIIVDRSTAIDPLSGNLRMQKCPFRRIPLTLPVYEIYPLQEKLRAWEHSRLERCISVAQSMIKEEQYERAKRCFEIAHGFLEEHQQERSLFQHHAQQPHDINNVCFGFLSINGSNASASQVQSSREILLLAIQLAQLERELPGVKDDIARTVRIHQRLISVAHACSTDKEDLQTLTIACLEDCWRRCSMLLAFAGKDASKKALQIRHAFAPVIKYTTLMYLNLMEELQKLCTLDLTLAKHVEDEPSIWNCRRVLLKLLQDPERAAFLASEGITGQEDDLYYHLIYDHSLWPHEHFADPSIGLVHFGTTTTTTILFSTTTNPSLSADIPTQTRGLACKVNLNPRRNGDHWIEVAFRADNLQSPGYLNSLISQHCSGSGWEIRCAVKPKSTFPWLNDDSAGGIHVEAVWTTANGGMGSPDHNEFTNTKVPITIATWYHVILAYCHATRTLSLYVNGQVVRRKIVGNFVPSQTLPKLGQNHQWPERRFQGWIAFGGGGYDLPVCGEDESALDEHVQKLAKARLSKLPKQPAMHPLKAAQLEADEADEGGGSSPEDSGDSGDCSNSEEESSSESAEPSEPEGSD